MQENDTFQLVMSQGPRPGQIFELPRGTLSIGRDPGNQVVINDPQVSRQHARITPQGGLVVLEDLGSTNGTTVNGIRITGPHTLAHGDEIGLGDNVTLIFYGRPTTDAGDTVATARAPAAPPSPHQPPPPPAYEPPLAYDSSAADYAQPGAQGYETYPEYYDQYPEEEERNWALIGLSCLLVAIIVMLLVAVLVYFFAPASIVDPIADFLAGLGVNVP